MGAVVTLALWVTTTQTASWLYQGGLAGYALMSCLLIVAAIRRGPLRAALSNRVLRWLGAISYGAYLFHWPIYLWLTPARTGLSLWPLFGLRLAVTLAAAVVSARLLEAPVRQRHFLPRIRPSVLSAGAIAGIVVALIAVTAAPQTGLISFAAPAGPSLPKVHSDHLDVDHDGDDHAGSGAAATAPMAPKVPLAAGAPPRVLIFGDSAALTLGDGLVQVGPGHRQDPGVGRRQARLPGRSGRRHPLPGPGDRRLWLLRLDHDAAPGDQRHPTPDHPGAVRDLGRVRSADPRRHAVARHR